MGYFGALSWLNGLNRFGERCDHDGDEDALIPTFSPASPGAGRIEPSKLLAAARTEPDQGASLAKVTVPAQIPPFDLAQRSPTDVA